MGIIELRTDPDHIFFMYLLATLLAIYPIIKTLKLYSKIKSKEYLIIFYVFFGMVFTLYPWLAYLQYATVAWFEYQFNQDDRWWQFHYIIVIFRFLYFSGQIALFLHTTRLRSWDSYSNKIKVLITVYGIELFLTGLVWWVTFDFYFAINQRWDLYFQRELLAEKWFFRVSILYFFFPTLILDTISYILLDLYLIVAYITFKPEIDHKAVKQTRIGWIGFGVINLLSDAVTFVLNRKYEFLEVDVDTTRQIGQIALITTIISMIIIMLMVIYYPEALLVSKYQIARAHNLYELINTNPGLSGGLFDYETRLLEYVKSLPPEYLQKSLE